MEQEPEKEESKFYSFFPPIIAIAVILGVFYGMFYMLGFFRGEDERQATMPAQFIGEKYIDQLDVGEAGYISYVYVSVDENLKVWVNDYTRTITNPTESDIKVIKVDDKYLELTLSAGYNYEWSISRVDHFLGGSWKVSKVTIEERN